MLDKLLRCKTLEDMTLFGARLIDATAISELRLGIKKEKLVFSFDSYWEEYKFGLYSVSELIEEASKEDLCRRVLHLLQILRSCCPAIAGPIDKLLASTTY